MSVITQFGSLSILAFTLFATQAIVQSHMDGNLVGMLMSFSKWFLGEDGKFCWSLPALFTILFKAVSPDLDLGLAMGFLAFNVTLNGVLWYGLKLNSVLGNRNVSLAFIKN